MQNFSTHFFYNYLMDFYQNMEIVNDQYAVACKGLKTGKKNAYMQFDIFYSVKIAVNIFFHLKKLVRMF